MTEKQLERDDDVDEEEENQMVELWQSVVEESGVVVVEELKITNLQFVLDDIKSKYVLGSGSNKTQSTSSKGTLRTIPPETPQKTEESQAPEGAGILSPPRKEKQKPTSFFAHLDEADNVSVSSELTTHSQAQLKLNNNTEDAGTGSRASFDSTYDSVSQGTFDTVASQGTFNSIASVGTFNTIPSVKEAQAKESTTKQATALNGASSDEDEDDIEALEQGQSKTTTDESLPIKPSNTKRLAEGTIFDEPTSEEGSSAPFGLKSEALSVTLMQKAQALIYMDNRNIDGRGLIDENFKWIQPVTLWQKGVEYQVASAAEMTHIITDYATAHSCDQPQMDSLEPIIERFLTLHVGLSFYDRPNFLIRLRSHPPCELVSYANQMTLPHSIRPPANLPNEQMIDYHVGFTQTKYSDEDAVKIASLMDKCETKFTYSSRQMRGTPKQKTNWHKLSNDAMGAVVRTYCTFHKMPTTGKPADPAKNIIAQILLQAHLNVEGKPIHSFVPRIINFTLHELNMQWRQVCANSNIPVTATFWPLESQKAAKT